MSREHDKRLNHTCIGQHRRGEETRRTLEVTFVRPEAVTPGRLVLTNRSLYFHPQRPNSQRAKAEAASTWGSGGGACMGRRDPRC